MSVLGPVLSSRFTQNDFDDAAENVSIIDRPSDFNWPDSMPDVKAVRVGGDFDCSVKPSDLIDYSSWASLYVDPDNGSDGNDGQSWATAKRSIASAIAAANTSGLASAVYCKGGVYSRFKSFSVGAIIDVQVDIAFVAVYGRVEVGPFESLSWSQNSTYSNVYETSRSVAQQVFNTQILDQNGQHLKYQYVADLATCAAVAGSWYTDNATVYVHTHTESPANDLNARVYLASRNANFTANNHDIYMYGFDLFGGNGGGFLTREGSTNTVVLEDCTIKHALAGDQFSGISEVDGAVILDCGLFAAFNSSASFNSKDGFNVHERNAVIPRALFVNCKPQENGKIISTTQSANGITLHDGIKAIIIGGECLGSVGTNCGHVNDDTEVWHVGVTAGNSEGDEINGGAINWGAFGVWSGSAVMWLDYCTDVGSAIGIYAGVGATAYVRNHNGSGARVGNVVAY